MIVDYESKLKNVPLDEVKAYLVREMKKDICEAFRHIKEIEAIQFDDEQVKIFNTVPYPGFLIDKTNRLVRGTYVDIVK